MLKMNPCVVLIFHPGSLMQREGAFDGKSEGCKEMLGTLLGPLKVGA